MAARFPCDFTDVGIGDPKRFPAADLERLYHGAQANEPRIRGDDLNKLLRVKTYKANAWYIITNEGVEQL